MKSILIAAVLLFSASAFAQDAPKVGDELPPQVKPKVPTGCKSLGTVGGTKLWAGDCVATELRRNEPRGPFDARAQRRNEARGPIDARSPRRNAAREPVDARPPAEEKNWWGW
jgi:hypothetical protein